MVSDQNQSNLELDLFGEPIAPPADAPLPITEPLSIAHHGIALEIFGKGVVIVGKSGIGKSELGLELIDRGHRLICDDLVAGTLEQQQVILSSPQEFGHGFMEIRGIGFINLAHFFSPDTLCPTKELFIIIQLVNNSMLDLTNQNRLLQLISSVEILGIDIPLYKLPIGANRNLPVLVELMVRYATARASGYDSHQEFIAQQLLYLNKD